MQVVTGTNFTRYEDDSEGTLYEAWVYTDGRPNRYGVDCAPVSTLPDTPAANLVRLAAA